MQSAFFPLHKQQLSTALGPQGRVFLPKAAAGRDAGGEAKWAQEGPAAWGQAGESRRRSLEGCVPWASCETRLLAYSAAMPLPLHEAARSFSSCQGLLRPLCKTYFQFCLPQPPGGQLEPSPVGTADIKCRAARLLSSGWDGGSPDLHLLFCPLVPCNPNLLNTFLDKNLVRGRVTWLEGHWDHI